LFISKLKFLSYLSFLYALIGIGGLGVVAIAGSTEYGAKLNISLGPVTIQPSEFIKILFVFFVASVLYEWEDLSELIYATAVAMLHVLLLIASNSFMTFAWYGNLLLKQRHISDNWSLPKVILLSWLIAGVEYCFLIPANSIGSDINGGPFTLMQLKVIQEVISISVFTVIALMCFQGQQLHWNHIAAFICLIAAVCFVFYK
jgi:uncharacterized protein (DUF486 family)